MTEPLLRALSRLRAMLLDPEQLLRAVASGRQRGRSTPWRRVEFRYVDLAAGRHLQIISYDDTQAHTANFAAGDQARDALDDLLELPFGNWHLETTTQVHQVRVTKRLEAQVHVADREEPVPVDRSHDQARERVLAEDDPVLIALGISDAEGRVKPTRRAKYRQVEEFLRHLDATIAEARAGGALRRPTADEPLRLVDLGCGNAYLTLAAAAHLAATGVPVRVTGVDVKEQARAHNTATATALGLPADFVAGSIAEAVLADPPDLVLALHACDTATDDALARAIGWQAPVVLAAPCCHHDVAAQLRAHPTPAPFASITRHGILRERLADTLTDALRAAILRIEGYRVEVVEFVGSEHTPRNTLLRAIRTGGRVKGGGVRRDYDDLVALWGLRPALALRTGLAEPSSDPP